jgi:transposase InsO family protein
MESFFGHMKDELGLRRQRGESVLAYAKIKTLLAGWIEEYNTIRPHSTLQGFSPIEYRLVMDEKDKNRLQ